MNANNAINVFKNIVGVEVATIQDVVKAQSAGLYITGKDGWGMITTSRMKRTEKKNSNRARNLRPHHQGTCSWRKGLRMHDACQ